MRVLYKCYKISLASIIAARCSIPARGYALGGRLYQITTSTEKLINVCGFFGARIAYGG